MSEFITFYPPPEDQVDKSLHAVTISIRNGKSFDPIPSKQICDEGKVHLYTCEMKDPTIKALIQLFLGVEKEKWTEIESKLAKDIADATDTVLNFECCSGMNCIQGFPSAISNDLVMSLTQTVLNKGGLVMFSDWSLKALIASWKPKWFGPNPFTYEGTCEGQVTLTFDRKVLEDCPSGQLQAVGSICSSDTETGVGVAKVRTLPSTIVYGLSKEARTAEEYDIQVLTINTHITSTRGVCITKEEAKYKVCKVGDQIGLPGHVLITFPSKGQILASNVHWKDLLNLDVSLEAMEEKLSDKDALELKTALKKCETTKERNDAIRSKYTSYVSKYSSSRTGQYFTITPTDSSNSSKTDCTKTSPSTKERKQTGYSSGMALAGPSSEEEEEEEEEFEETGEKGDTTAFTTSSRRGSGYASVPALHNNQRAVYCSGTALCDSI